ncbi:hypothetical protein FQZ97_1136450 [compost metagenome]
MSGAGDPAIDYLAHGVLSGGDVLADLLAAVTRQLCPITGRAAIAVLVIEIVVVGHRPRMGLGRRCQDSVPGQRRGGSEGLRAALARPTACDIELGQQFLAFGLPVAQPCAQQWTGQHNAPFTVLAAHTNVDELRVQHDLAKALLDRFHR